MKRAVRSNLILLGIVAVLGMAVYLTVQREIAQFEPPLTSLDPGFVRHVTVGCLQCVPRRFERVDGHWKMLEPYAMPADDGLVDRLVAIAVSPVRSRRPLDSLDAEKIGLAPPLMTLEVDRLRLAIGRTDALNGDRYVAVGDSIAMVPDRFSPFLMAAPASELDRHLVPRGSTLASLRIDGIERPELAAAWRRAVASRVTPADVSSGGALATAELRLGDGSSIRYEITLDAGATIARRDQPALGFALLPEQVQSLLGDAAPGSR